MRHSKTGPFAMQQSRYAHRTGGRRKGAIHIFRQIKMKTDILAFILLDWRSSMTYGYIRVSTDKQTVENQKFEITNFCKQEKLSVDGWIEETISGTAIVAILEGMRPLMIEIQALVSTAVYGTPQRTTTGFNVKRLNMLLAVLEKRAGFRLGSKDVFLNITGGISIDDPSTDLGVAMAILSSNEDIAIPKNICFAGEIGLGGEIRPVQRVEQRISEAEKLGFDTIFISKYNKISSEKQGMNIVKYAKIEEVIEHLFE